MVIFPHMAPIEMPSASSNPNPFYLKFIRGNRQTYQGCRGSLRASNSLIPAAPDDLCIACAEKRPTLVFLLPPARTYKPSHYHAQLTSVRAAEPSFMPHSLSIPPDFSEQWSTNSGALRTRERATDIIQRRADRA